MRTAWPPVSPRLWRRVYVGVALLVGLWLSLVTPPYFVADEQAHALRALEVASGRILARHGQQGVGDWVDASVLQSMAVMSRTQAELERGYEVHRDPSVTPLTESEVDEARGLVWSGHEQFVQFQNTAVYPPWSYLPQALGWRLAEALRLRVVQSLLLARACTCAASALLGWLALRLCVSGRWLLWGYLLLPTSLSLAASCSQDALLFPLAGLLLAVLGQAIAGRRTLRRWELGLCSLLLVLLVGARLPYLPLVVALFLPGREAEPRGRRAWFGPALCALLVVAAVAGWQLAIHPLGTYLSADARPAAQVHYVEQHPAAAAWTLVEGTARWVPALAGRGLALFGRTNDFAYPLPVDGLLLLALAGLLLLSPIAGLRTWRARGLLCFTLLSVVAGMSLAEYIIWNKPGAHTVAGLQSRYFIPLLPLASLLLPRRVERPGWRRLLLCASAAVCTAIALSAPWIVARAYFRTGPVAAARAALR